jgi:hypothetical protein
MWLVGWVYFQSPWFANSSVVIASFTGTLWSGRKSPPVQLPSATPLTLAVLDAVCVKSFLRFRMSLRRLWVWYIFSAATQDLGLLSGGMVIPYSQPGTEVVNCYPKQMSFQKTSRASLHPQVQRLVIPNLKIWNPKCWNVLNAMILQMENSTSDLTWWVRVKMQVH